jgi:hypothetical protein
LFLSTFHFVISKKKMARSHHRKKHKEHLRQFKHRGETVSAKQKSKASGIFTVAGAIIGLAVSYFATDASYLWMAVGTVAGGIAGYFIGKKIDDDSK